MSLDAYIDGIVGLLREAGVPAAEIEAKGTEAALVTAFIKGRSFKDAAMAAFKAHDVEVEGEAADPQR